MNPNTVNASVPLFQRIGQLTNAAVDFAKPLAERIGQIGAGAVDSLKENFDTGPLLGRDTKTGKMVVNKDSAQKLAGLARGFAGTSAPVAVGEETGSALIDKVLTEHMTSAKQAAENLPAADLQELGGMPALLGQAQKNIADAMTTYKLPEVAEQVKNLDVSKFASPDEMSSAVEQLLHAHLGGAIAKMPEVLAGGLMLPLLGSHSKPGKADNTIFGMPKGQEDNRPIEDKLSGTTIFDRSKDVVNTDYPFTKGAQAIIEAIPIRQEGSDNMAAEAQYTGSRGPVSRFFTNIFGGKAEDISPRLYSALSGEHISIDDATHSLTTAHEVLHGLFAREGINIAQFDKDWETAKKNDNDGVLAYIDDKQLKTDLYKGIDDRQRANERFAYLGSMSGKNGLASLPPELQKYYSDVFRPTQNNPEFLLRQAIGTNETGGIDQEKQYGYSKSSGSKKLGKDLGKYQVTEGELKSYGKQFLGAAVTAKEFLDDPNLQDKYMTNKIRFLTSEGLSPDQIAAVHSQGMTGYGDEAKLAGKVTDANKYRKGYVKRVLDQLAQSPGPAGQ